MRFLSFFLIFLLFSLPSAAQKTELENIRWNETKKLSWEDFRAVPSDSSKFYAITHSGITFGWNYSTKTGKPILTHDIYAKFTPGKSWVKMEHASDDLLAHEQTHFDISEIYARKLRKLISEYEPGEDVKAELRSMYDRIGSERDIMQKRYDKSTDHGRNLQAEEGWRKIIELELQKLEDFSV